MPSRRDMLKGLFGTAVLIGNVPVFAKLDETDPIKLVYDKRIDVEQQISAIAKKYGFDSIDPEGETVRFFNGEGKAWLDSDQPIVGLTAYADFVLMSGIAIENNRAVTYAVLRRSSGEPTVLIDANKGINHPPRIAQILSDFSLQSEKGGIAWVIS